MFTVLKFIGAPGSIPFLVTTLLIGAGVIRYAPRYRRAAIAGLMTITIGYVVLALPLVANTIASALPSVSLEGRSMDSHDGGLTVIVLDGDNRRGRVREVQRVLDSEPSATVWVLGGRWILEALAEESVRGDGFRYDDRAGTTREQIDQVAAIARTAPGTRTAVIASRLQAPRVDALIRSRGIDARIFPAAVDDEPPVAGIGAFIPSYIALRVSRDAIYEHAALAFYRWRGWIS